MQLLHEKYAIWETFRFYAIWELYHLRRNLKQSITNKLIFSHCSRKSGSRVFQCNCCLKVMPFGKLHFYAIWELRHLRRNLKQSSTNQQTCKPAENTGLLHDIDKMRNANAYISTKTRIAGYCASSTEYPTIVITLAIASVNKPEYRLFSG